MRLKVNRKLDLPALDAFVKTKAVTTAETIVEETMKFRKLSWNESDAALWQGAPPQVEILVDAKNGFLLTVYFQIDAKKTVLREAGLMALFDGMLKHAGVYGRYNPKVRGIVVQLSVSMRRRRVGCGCGRSLSAALARCDRAQKEKHSKRMSVTDQEFKDPSEKAALQDAKDLLAKQPSAADLLGRPDAGWKSAAGSEATSVQK